MLKIYSYSGCGTCRKAIAFLKEKGIKYKEVAIRETPPSLPELQLALKEVEGDRGKLFNRSGKDYRELGLSKTLPTLSDDAALKLLAGNGNLVKRPFVLLNGHKKTDQKVLIGFNETSWQDIFEKQGF
ncbi:MAG: Spx/MgsR family RNA polymerase-binding regulatory protein [Chthoniobacterales bacterium]